MKVNLLKKVLVSTSIALALSACDSNTGTFSGYDDDLKPVTHNGDMNLTFNEDDGVVFLNLLDGVTNPEQTEIYSGQFKFYRIELDEAGQPVFDENGVTIPLYEGPDLPFGTVFKSLEDVRVDLATFADVLVHPDTVAENGGEGEPNGEGGPIVYSYGKYRFTYEMNNGADDAVERTIWLTVNGVEDVLTDIEFNHPTGLIANPGFDSQVLTMPVPSNATYPEFTYSITPTSVATIDANTGLITGVALGEFTVTATSVQYPDISTDIMGDVVPLEYPLGIDLKIDSVSKTNTSLSSGTSVQLEAERLPAGEDFVNPGTITWESMDSDRVTVDENGMITAVNYDLNTENRSNFVDVIATVDGLNGPVTKTITVQVTEHTTDYFASFNSAVELGTMSAAITKYWENKIAPVATAEAAKDGNYGIHIVSDGEKHTGLTIGANLVNQIVGQGLGRKFKVSYDLKLNSFDTDGNSAMRFYLVAQGSWPTRVEKWHKPATSSEWTHVEVEFDETDWTGAANPGRFDLYFINGTPIDAYIDNLSLTEVIAPE